MSIKILCVDDEENVLAGLQRTLRKNFQLDVAAGGPAGLQRLERDGPYAVVLADMQMPELNGIELLQKAQARWPDTVRVMLTGNADQKTAVEAVNRGQVFRFLNKPCDPDALTDTLQDALRRHQVILAERQLLENTLNGAVKCLVDILAFLDQKAFTKGQRLREYMRSFRKVYHHGEAWEMELAAMLALVGRVTIPAPVLLKEQTGVPLTVPEQDMLARVPEVGARLLENIPRLEPVARIVRFQGKNFDGTGLPQEPLSGENIPVGARALRVLIDLLDLEERGMSRPAALAQMQAKPGFYDPVMLTLACQSFDVSPEDLARSGPATRTVRVADLVPGHILAKDLKAKDGVLILSAGNKLSIFLIERIRNFAALETIADEVVISGSAQ